VRTVLMVDDSEDLRRVFLTYLPMAGYECVASSSVNEAMGILAICQVDVVILDLILPGEHTDSLLAACVRSGTPVIVFTGLDVDTAKKHAPSGLPVLTKPAHPDELLEAIRQAINARTESSACQEV